MLEKERVKGLETLLDFHILTSVTLNFAHTSATSLYRGTCLHTPVLQRFIEVLVQHRNTEVLRGRRWTSSVWGDWGSHSIHTNKCYNVIARYLWKLAQIVWNVIYKRLARCSYRGLGKSTSLFFGTSGCDCVLLWSTSIWYKNQHTHTLPQLGWKLR